MNQLFKALGTTKQSFHQYHNRLLIRLEHEAYLVHLIEQIRVDHPSMGMRDMYYKLSPDNIGRDAFEELCRVHGYTVKRRKNLKKTTQSNGVKRFENLIVDMELTAPDQLWVSDITYFEVAGRFYYITFVLDVFTRRILGYSVSKRLFTEVTTLFALKMAIKTRNTTNYKGLIFHSDGGGQYYDKEFLKLTRELGILNSMCKYAWENPYAERVNGTIKNNYLQYYQIDNYDQLVKSVDRAVKLYNYEKPHIGLNRLSPCQFENSIFVSGKQTDGEKSATELTNPEPERIQPFRLRGNKPQDQISLKNNKKSIVEHCQKTVNVI